MRKAFAWLLGAWLLYHGVGCAEESTSVGLTVERSSGDINLEDGVFPSGGAGAPVVRGPGEVATDANPPPAGRARRYDSPAPSGAAVSGGAPVSGFGSNPVGSNPIGSRAVSPAPVGSAPVAIAPVSSTPVGATPVSSTPVGSTPVGSVPLSSTPIGSTPVGSEPGGRAGQSSVASQSTPTATITPHPKVGENAPVPRTAADATPAQSESADRLIGPALHRPAAVDAPDDLTPLLDAARQRPEVSAPLRDPVTESPDRSAHSPSPSVRRGNVTEGQARPEKPAEVRSEQAVGGRVKNER